MEYPFKLSVSANQNIWCHTTEDNCGGNKIKSVHMSVGEATTHTAVSPHECRCHGWVTTWSGSSPASSAAFPLGSDEEWENPWDRAIWSDTGIVSSTYAGWWRSRYQTQQHASVLWTAENKQYNKLFKSESNDNLKYVLSHNLLNTKGSQWLHFFNVVLYCHLLATLQTMTIIVET